MSRKVAGLLCVVFLAALCIGQAAGGEPTAVPEDAQQSMRAGVPPFSTTAASELDSVQLAVMASYFGVRPSAIERFRWTPSLAPPGHPDHGVATYTVWCAIDGVSQQLSVRAAPVPAAESGAVETPPVPPSAPESGAVETLTDSLVSISLRDGTTLTGQIVQEQENSITVVTPSGLEVKVPRSSILAINRAQGRMVEGVYYRSDPNYSRLMFAPTGRPLRRGEGYFSDYYVFFPGISYGFTDQISFTAGLSVFPGVDLDEQILSLAPRIGVRLSEEHALSVGTLYMTVGGEGSAGIAFAVASAGHPDKSFTAGIGYGYIHENGEGVDFAEHPILMLGGSVRLSNSVALVSENWLITGEGLGLDEQPLGLAFRFFGERIAVDAGTIIIGALLEEGFPIPWLSFVYHFDK